jgi:voltage-gated potassium channel
MSLDTVRRRAWEILEIARPGDRASERFDVAIRLLIVLNVLAVILETMRSVDQVLHGFFRAFEAFSVAVFTLEYIGRVWSCVEAPRYRRPLRGRLRFAATPLAIVDLLAVLPSLLPFLGLDLRVLRGLRLFRLFRILKLTRYSRSMQTMGGAFRRSREELVITLSAAGMAVLIASSVMYFAENAAQPDQFSSIPASMWWGVVTLTTLGYGDIYPVTLPGQIMGGVFAISGILLIALPTAILGAAFVEELRGGTERPSDDSAHDDLAHGDAAPAGATHDRALCPACGQPVSVSRERGG